LEGKTAASEGDSTTSKELRKKRSGAARGLERTKERACIYAFSFFVAKAQEKTIPEESDGEKPDRGSKRRGEDKERRYEVNNMGLL